MERHFVERRRHVTLVGQKTQPCSFAFRGLEIHSLRMFDTTQVLNTLDIMVRFGLNALIFHRNTLLDDLVFPEKFYSMQKMWDRFAPRYSWTLNIRYYINNIIAECHRRGIAFFAEVKELSFDEWIIEDHPEVRNPQTGRVCPMHPFWWEYLEAKMDEVLDSVPELDGIIVSPGTLESKLSISANKCGCDACRNADDTGWNARLMGVMHEKLKERGKRLVVRDFCFSAKDQTTILKGADRASEEIVIALKNTPHDYYPTFPTNPAIGHSGHEEWVEFDTWGQFVGNGIFPVSLVEDMIVRMREIYERGVKGVWLRTDWENMLDHGTLNSLNMVNLIAGAMLAANVYITADEIYAQWMKYGIVSPLKPASFDQAPYPVTDSQTAHKLITFMQESWKIMQKTVFLQDHLFQDNSMFPYSMERCFAIMLKIHSMDEWKPGASLRVQPTEENIRRILEEKGEAVDQAYALRTLLEPETLCLPEDIKEDLVDMIDLYVYYTRCFLLCARACYACWKFEKTHDRVDRERVLSVLAEVAAYAPVLRARVQKRSYTHEVPRLLDCERLRHLYVNINEHMKRVEEEDGREGGA